MAYEIYLTTADSHPTASRELTDCQVVLSWDLQQHATLFCQHKELLDNFPVTNGLSNYYGDVVYMGEEREELKAELIALERSLADDPAACSVIAGILGVAEQAILMNKTIYGRSER